MKKYILVLLMTILQVGFIKTYGQTKIGLPIDLNINVKLLGNRSLNLEKFKDKLLIIDFFNTYCTSCIEAMPKNNLIQQNNRDIIILPVSYEKHDRIKSFFKSNDYVKNNKLPIVVEDEELSVLFPHQSVSHMVWIYNGKLIAITMGDMLTDGNVKQVLAGKDVSNWPLKDDFFVPEESDESIREGMIFGSKISSYVNGATTEYQLDTIGNKVSLKMVNAPIIAAFNYLYNEIEPLPLMKKERVVLKVSQIERFEKPDTMIMSSWLQKYAFCYETTWPIGIDKKMMHRSIISELSNRLGIEVQLADHPASVWLVTKINTESVTANGESKKTPLGIWLTTLEIFNSDFPPIMLNGDKKELVQPVEISSFEELKKALDIMGFELTKEMKPILTLMIKSK
jgi:thiol-disulfide isomerase/thioredoxin